MKHACVRLIDQYFFVTYSCFSNEHLCINAIPCDHDSLMLGTTNTTRENYKSVNIAGDSKPSSFISRLML